MSLTVVGNRRSHGILSITIDYAHLPTGFVHGYIYMIRTYLTFDDACPIEKWRKLSDIVCAVKIIHKLGLTGESNSLSPDIYQCMLPSMINDWRARWNSRTGGNTDLLLPFGQVQVRRMFLSLTLLILKYFLFKLWLHRRSNKTCNLWLYRGSAFLIGFANLSSRKGKIWLYKSANNISRLHV